MYKRRGQSQCKVMVLNGEEELECEVYVDRILLELVSKLNIWGVLDESGIR